MKQLIIILLIISQQFASAYEACSRIAVINQQEILVDPSNTRKGEGLRFHLEKDEIAKSYLTKYQETGQNYIRPAIIGTIGTGLILSAFISNSSSKNRRALLISGSATLLVNFMITKTIDSGNEKHLIRAIEEYNKRHYPKIFLKVDENSQVQPGVMMQKNWSF